MAIEMYVTSVDPQSGKSVQLEDRTILPTLGPEEDTLAVQLQELFESVTEKVAATIESESKLTIEVTGSLTLKTQGTVKYLFFNVGGEAGKTGTMKVTLSTNLQPKTKSSP